MQSIQIDGTYTYAENIKSLKLGDIIKLIPNPSNRLNSDAIGAYTLSGSKIGYVPFKSNQIDIKSKYTVTKIKLTQDHPVLLISRNFENSNFINIEPLFIRTIKPDKIIKSNIESDIKQFSKFLEKSGNEITNIGVTFQDSNYIDLYIETPESNTIFYTVTKKYYEENIFKYDEFYNFKLIPKCIYQQFQIHRLEIYIEKNYKPIEKILKSRKLKFDNLVKLNIFNLDNLDNLDKSDDSDNFISKDNFGFEKYNHADLKILSQTQLEKLVNNKEQLANLIKLIILHTQLTNYNLTSILNNKQSNSYLNPNNYLELINSTKNENQIITNLTQLNNEFNELKIGGICYNHKIKSYCFIDMYDDLNIVEISMDKNITKEKLVELIIKLIISNKQIINLYNPLKGYILKLAIPEQILYKISELMC